jgi:RNA polymerase sigma factor (TIGR02999 family)
VYVELRALAEAFLRRERAGHTLQPTALVNEAYLRLADKTIVASQGREHFVAVAAETMRRVLVDHARKRAALKRGGGRTRLASGDGLSSPEPEVDVLALNDALDKLARLDQRHAKVVELKFFGGLGVEQIAWLLGVSHRTVEADWALARAWLRRELGQGPSPAPGGRTERGTP